MRTIGIAGLVLLLTCSISCRKEPDKVIYKNLFSNPKILEIIRNTGCVDLGTSDSLQHLAGKWHIENHETKYGDKYFVAYPRNIFLFDSTGLQEQPFSIQYKSQSPKPQRVKILINSHPLGERDVPSRWTRHEWMIPREYLLMGENILRVENRHGLGIDSICIGEPSQYVTASSVNLVIVPLNSVVPLYFRVPEKAVLKAEFGIDKKSDSGSGARFEIWVEQDGLKPSKLHSQTIQRGFFKSSSASIDLDLSKFSGKTIRVAMAVFPAKVQKKPITAFWKKAVVTIPKEKAHVTLAKQTNIKKPKNIFFYLVDTLRADHLQPYGYSRPISTRINEFARDAVLFERAYSQTAWTRSSIACIQTGIYQSSHLVEDRMDILPAFLPTLQNTLKSNGFFTMGIVTNANLIRTFKLSRGFEIYHSIPGRRKKPGISPHSGEVYALAEKTLKENKRLQPFYLYVHVMDPHHPYSPEIGAPENRSLPECKADPKSNNCIIALYDGEVYNSDHYFGKFIDLIKQLGLYDDALIILTADHGESLGEHDTTHHGTTLYNSEISVPLIIKFPENAFAGKRISTVVGHIDLFPTITSLLSIRNPHGLQGQSLIPILEYSPKDERPIFAEILLDEVDKKSMIEGPNKIIASAYHNRLTGRPGMYYEMYDLIADPHELRDIHFDKPVLFGYMKSRLNEWAIQQALHKATLKKPNGADIDAETKELLRTLGYLQ
jgi:choline-sulfatase